MLLLWAIQSCLWASPKREGFHSSRSVFLVLLTSPFPYASTNLNIACWTSCCFVIECSVTFSVSHSDKPGRSGHRCLWPYTRLWAVAETRMQVFPVSFLTSVGFSKHSCLPGSSDSKSSAVSVAFQVIPEPEHISPGQREVQVIFCTDIPSQKAPPLSGAGLVQVRERFCQPRPHRALQFDHSVHDDQPPLTAKHKVQWPVGSKRKVKVGTSILIKYALLKS